MFSLCLLRHRAVNLFLQGYEKSWIEAEEHYFEDQLIEDLAVSVRGVWIFCRACCNLLPCSA